MSSNLINDLKKTFNVELENLGYELVDIEFIQESGDFYLRFYIYKEEGISLDDCEIVSKYLDTRLDELDPINRQYYLEVSSPDLNRPLKTNDDLRRNLNVDLVVNLYKKIDNSKSFEGTLINYDDESITLLIDENKEKKIDREDISLIKVLLKF